MEMVSVEQLKDIIEIDDTCKQLGLKQNSSEAYKLWKELIEEIKHGRARDNTQM